MLDANHLKSKLQEKKEKYITKAKLERKRKMQSQI